MQYERSYESSPKILQYPIPYFYLYFYSFFALVNVIMYHIVSIVGFY